MQKNLATLLTDKQVTSIQSHALRQVVEDMRKENPNMSPTLAYTEKHSRHYGKCSAHFLVNK